MTKKQKPRMAIPRPEEVEYLKRWKGVKGPSTFFEKMENDVVYRDTVMSRTDIDADGCKMGNHWGIRKSKLPDQER